MSIIGDKYHILDYIETIEYDKLYKAIDISSDEEVYLKLYTNTDIMNENFVDKLIKVSQKINEIKNDYILQIKDIGFHYTKEDVMFYNVYEYVDAITLEEAIRGDYISKEVAVYSVIQIARGLEDYISDNLYHGDLKPSNILIDYQCNIKILNFGLTKANDGINIRMNKDINYLSPHQLCIDYTDLESDLFSLGLILFELIFKIPAYTIVDNNDEIEKLRILDKDINWNSIKYEKDEVEIVNIIKRLLIRDKKYNDLDEVIKELTLAIAKL